jgi:hypothetical protein
VNRHADNLADNLARLPKELMPIDTSGGRTSFDKPHFPWSLHGDVVKTWAVLAV